MSLRVIRSPEPQTPWWQPIATGVFDKVLVPMLSNAIEDQRQRDKNRKQNVYNSEVQKALDNVISGGQSGGLLQNGGQPAPEGYNDNPWAQAFHKNNSPLVDFDTNTAGVTPFTALSGTAQQRRTPTMAEISQVYNQMRCNPRFSGVSPEFIDNSMKNAITMAEAQRIQDARNNYIKQYGDAKDWDSRMDILTQANIDGIANDNLYRNATDYAKFRQPSKQPYTQNTGGTTRYGSFDPATGTWTQAGEYTNTLTPEQVQAGEKWNKTHEASRIDADRNYNASRIDADRKYELDKKGTPTITTYPDGRRIATYRDGSEIELTPGVAGLSPVEAQKVKSLEEKRNELFKHKDTIAQGLKNATTQAQHDAIVAQMDKVQAQIDKLDDEINSMYEAKLNPRKKATIGLGTGSDIGWNMVGGQGNWTISSEYGKERTKADGTKYPHKGRDYAITKGSEILAPDIGTPLKVINVSKQADGYGNYATLRGQINGHTVQFTIAHMQDGVNVKQGDTLYAGDLIGFVGNTGNSRGKNGGYHMHLECRVDNKLVDPAKVQNIVASFSPTQTTATTMGQQPPQQPQAQPAGNTSNGTQPEATTNAQPAQAQETEANLNTNVSLLPPPLNGDPQTITTTPAGAPVANNHNGVWDTISNLVGASAAEANELPQQRSLSTFPSSDNPFSDRISNTEWQQGLQRAETEKTNGRLALKPTNPFPDRLSDLEWQTAWQTAQADKSAMDAEDNSEAQRTGMRNLVYRMPKNPIPDRISNAEWTNVWHNADFELSGKQWEYEERFPNNPFPDKITSQEWANAWMNRPGNIKLLGMDAENQTAQEEPHSDYNPMDIDPTPTSGGRAKVRQRSAKAPTQQPLQLDSKGRTNYSALKDTIDTAASNNGIDPELIQAIIKIESDWKPNARSNKGAKGLMQLMPATAKGLGVRNAYDAAQNINGGSKYIADLIKRYNGDVSKALMAYNCGPGNVNRGRIPNVSKQYARNVMGIYNRLKANGAPQPAQNTTLMPPTSADNYSAVAPQFNTSAQPQSLLPLQQLNTLGGESISWVNGSTNQPMFTHEGDLFTDRLYNEWAQQADAGKFFDRAIYNREDLDKWLDSIGMHRVRPSVDRALSRLNSSRPQTNLQNNLDVYDADIAPLPQTPQNTPAHYPAPSFTDDLNHTRPEDLQDMLDDLNGLARGEYQGWSSAFHRIFGSPTQRFGRY